MPFGSGSITDYHIYEIRWRVNEVSWLIDGNVVRRKESNIPTGPMHLHLNMWAPSAEWIEAYDSNLQPTQPPELNEVFSMLVDFVDIEGAPTFQDVSTDYWAFPAIQTLSNAAVTQGCGDNPMRFCSEESVTRAQMAVFLIRATDPTLSIPPPAMGIFEDVPWDYWAADWIEQLYNEGITKGCHINRLRYCPEDEVTRAEMAVFLLRALKGADYDPPLAIGIFADVPVGHWAAAWIEDLFNQRITTGCSNNPLAFCPDDSVSRAQMAAFLVRAFDL